MVMQKKDSQNRTLALWAIDPHESDLIPSYEALQEVRHFLGGSFEHVYPTYVHFASAAPWVQPEVRTRDYLDRLLVGKTAGVHIIEIKSDLISDGVDSLLKYAESQMATVILLTSHGRSALGQFIYGSFAYEVLQRSKIPVLFMAPKKIQARSDRALFATDFHESTFKSYQNFLKFISGSTSELMLFHSVTFPAAAMVSAYIPGDLPEKIIADEVVWAKDEMDRWALEAKKYGITTRVCKNVEENFMSASEAINRIATKQNAGVVGVASHTGAQSGPFGNNVARQMIRAKDFSIWVTGPQFS
ncbi:MAG: universal stress protein [Bdellovibrionaceae bacterium]|nr:universal stress protein [Pseudobdellovibrionaceae bacterium]